MDSKKLNSLITMLLKIAEDGGNVTKYNQVIIDLLQVENANNVILKEVNGKIVVVFNNNEGGISLITNE